MRRGLVACLCLLGVLALAPAVASAGSFVQTDGGFKYVFDGYQAGPGTTKVIAARCPGQTKVLGGGMTSFGDFGDAYVSSSYPDDRGDRDSKPDDAWVSRVSTFDSYVGGSAMAICARTAVSYRSRRYEIEPGLVRQ